MIVKCAQDIVIPRDLPWRVSHRATVKQHLLPLSAKKTGRQRSSWKERGAYTTNWGSFFHFFQVRNEIVSSFPNFSGETILINNKGNHFQVFGRFLQITRPTRQVFEVGALFLWPVVARWKNDCILFARYKEIFVNTTFLLFVDKAMIMRKLNTISQFEVVCVVVCSEKFTNISDNLLSSCRLMWSSSDWPYLPLSP